MTLGEGDFAKAELERADREVRSQADYGGEPFAASTEELAALAIDAEAFFQTCVEHVEVRVREGPDEAEPDADL